MMLPAFRGIKPLMGIEGLVNPRGFVIVDKHQMNPKYNNVFSVGVWRSYSTSWSNRTSGWRTKNGFYD